LNVATLLRVENGMRKTARPGKSQLWRKEVQPLVILALVLFSLRSSLADWNDVPTGSMEPTILVGDRVFVNRVAYDLKVPFTTIRLAQWANPERGDIVVFYSPHDGKRLVKRVIGLPGDVVELKQGKLLLNGEAVEYKSLVPQEVPDLQVDSDKIQGQQYALERLPGQPHIVASIPQARAMRDFGPRVVPKSFYFMMGDNRDNSFDSRYFGMVERERILGRVSRVAFSLDHDHLWCPRGGRFLKKINEG
jgi:signal peptidase I